MNLLLLTVFFLCLMLITCYKSKKDKSRVIATLFTVFGLIGIGLLLFLAYQEKVVAENDWLRFIGILLMIGFLLSEVPEIFGILPDIKKSYENEV